MGSQHGGQIAAWTVLTQRAYAAELMGAELMGAELIGAYQIAVSPHISPLPEPCV